MSTAKAVPQSTPKETDESTAEVVPQLTAADFADILAATLAMAAEAGLSVGIRNTETTATRPAGLLVFIAGLAADADGRLQAQ